MKKKCPRIGHSAHGPIVVVAVGVEVVVVVATAHGPHSSPVTLDRSLLLHTFALKELLVVAAAFYSNAVNA